MQKARGKRVHGNFLTDIIFENENIYLLFDDGDKLLIKNGKYSKERKKLFIGNKNISNSGWSMVLAAEVSATNTKSIF